MERDKVKILEDFYKVYLMQKEFCARLRKIIIDLGGEDPEKDSFQSAKTIKDKIKFILKEYENQKLTFEWLFNILKAYDPEINKVSLRHICVQMSKLGEIGVENGYRNRYFYKPKVS